MVHPHYPLEDAIASVCRVQRFIGPDSGEVTMPGLSEKQIRELKERLLTLRTEIEGLLAQTARDAKPVDLSLPIGRLSRADAMQMQGMAQMNRRQLDVKLQQIKGALAAVDDGSYGLCRSCREAIDSARLEVHPEVPFCIGCQEAFEQER
jgi:DnaK suppressor protein